MYGLKSCNYLVFDPVPSNNVSEGWRLGALTRLRKVMFHQDYRTNQYGIFFNSLLNFCYRQLLSLSLSPGKS